MQGQQLRAAALALHSQIQHERHITGRSAMAPHTQPEYMVEPEHVHLLLAAPLTNPSPGPGPGSADRATALALHSQIQHAVIGRSARGPHTQPEYLVEPEDAHLLVPFTNPGPSRANHNKT